MKYTYAKNLHNEDEVTIKSTGEVKYVVEVEVQGKDVFVRLDDGCIYHHTDIK